MVSLTDYLNESLRQHISVDVISVLEKHGSYVGCETQAIEICQALQEKAEDKKQQTITIDFSNINVPDKFFDKVRIILRNIPGRPDTSYDAYFGGKNFHDNKFGCIRLYIDCDVNDLINSKSIDGDLYSSVCHELMHTYEDFQLTKPGKDGLSKLLDYEYKQANDNLYKGKLVDFYKYFFMEPEKNAYIGELREQMLAKAKKLSIYDRNSSKKLLNEFKNTDIYKNYINIITAINSLNPEDDAVNDIMKLAAFKGMTPNKVVKKLKDDALRLKNKLEKTVAKTLSDCVEIIWPPRNIVYGSK